MLGGVEILCNKYVFIMVRYGSHEISIDMGPKQRKQILQLALL